MTESNRTSNLLLEQIRASLDVDFGREGQPPKVGSIHGIMSHAAAEIERLTAELAKKQDDWLVGLKAIAERDRLRAIARDCLASRPTSGNMREALEDIARTAVETKRDFGLRW